MGELITPSVPQAKLEGKSDNYIASYSDCYQDVAKSIHVKWAWYGLGAIVALYLIVFALTSISGGGHMSN